MEKCLAKNLHGLAGSLNYLWTTVALLLYLYNIYGFFVENYFLKKWQKIFLVIIGFFVAFSHEVMAFVGGAFLGILFLMNIKKVWKNSKKDTLFLISLLLFFGFGAMLTILAPGNVARSTLDGTQRGSVFACLGNYKDIKWQLLITLLSMIAIGLFKKNELIQK